MKRIMLLLSFCLATTLARDASAQAALREVMVQVKVNKDSEKKSKTATTQTITLDVILNGKPRDPETRKVKWIAYGKDLKTGDFVEMGSGESKLNLATGSTQKFATKPVTSTYSDKSTKVENSGDSYNRRVSYTEVPGEGVRYIGYAVRVLNGEQIVGEKFEPRSIADIKVAPPREDTEKKK